MMRKSERKVKSEIKVKRISSGISKQLFIKNSLLRKLVSTTTAIVFFSLLLLGLVTFFTMKTKVTEEFKQSTNQILNQNKNYIDLVNSNVENVSMQVLANSNYTTLFVTPVEDGYDQFVRKTEISKYLQSLNSSNSQHIIKNIYMFNDNGLSGSSNSENISNEKVEKVKGEE